MATVLRIQDVNKAFGLRRLFEDASVTVAEGQRIGFIGANGSGKTTLLRMVLGQETPDTGSVVIFPDVRLGYLEQHETFPPGETVMGYLVSVSGREPWECAKAAGAFDLKNERLELPFQSLSGGYQMRVRLAGVLVREPNLLLLDEPTNYLDLQTVLLLEEALRHFRGALLLVSHDREFLKNVCTHTLELENRRLTLFAGDIEAYFADKEHRLEETRRHNKKIREQQKHLQAFVDRFRAKASKATQAQSKLKQLAKLKTIEIGHSLRTVRIHIPAVPQRNAWALECVGLAVGYAPGKPVLEQVEFEMNRGEHLAVLGENGQGKTTLLRTLAGELPPLAGRFKFAHGLRLGYYAQHVPKMLPDFGSAGSYLSGIAGPILPEDLLRMAGNFLFTPDDLDKPISVLSGGERARLCLAALCLGRYDVLILDEPTNHLDFDTVEALAEALGEFPGTIVFVSHSRTFVSQIATMILDVRDGRAVRYPYPYDIYVHELKTHEKFVPESEGSAGNGLPFVRTKTEVYADIQKEKRALKRTEEELAKLDNEKKRLHRHFAENPTAVDVTKAKRLKEIDVQLTEHEAEWFAANERVTVLGNELKTASAE